MSVHIEAKENEIADKILLPGDPLRAEYIAKTFFQDAVCFNRVRGMLGFTGVYNGQRISVQGTGMGVPSISIYAHELMESYGVKQLIRVGTCGAFQKQIGVRDVILALGASTDSAFNKNRFHGLDFAPTASFALLEKAYHIARAQGILVHVGSVFTSDVFYSDNEQIVPLLTSYGTLAVEMETAALYTLAAKFGAQALSVLTVSDHLVTGEATTAEERQSTFNQMVEIALETFID